MTLSYQIVEGLGSIFASKNLITHRWNVNGCAPLRHVKRVKRVKALHRYTLVSDHTHLHSAFGVRCWNLSEKGSPAGFPTGPFYLEPNYSVISMQQPPTGQQEPPPQQSSPLEGTGVAAVSPTSAARMSKYFITPPVEFRLDLGHEHRAEPLRRRIRRVEADWGDGQSEPPHRNSSQELCGCRNPVRLAFPRHCTATPAPSMAQGSSATGIGKFHSHARSSYRGAAIAWCMRGFLCCRNAVAT